MPAYDVLESVPAEFGPPDRREERIAVGTGTFLDPGIQTRRNSDTNSPVAAIDQRNRSWCLGAV